MRIKKEFEVEIKDSDILNSGIPDGERFLIERLLDELLRLKEKGASHIRVSPFGGYNESPKVDITAYAYREETDKEYRKRLKEEKAGLEKIRQKEIKELERLEKKHR